MIRVSILFLLIFIYTNLNAQFSPQQFKLYGEKELAKVSDENPASNSISDIIAIGDTVWVGTSKGVSLSTDRGENWKNFYGSEAFGEENVSAIGYYKGTFWAATAHTTEANGQSLPEGSGLRYTTDLGATWKTVPQPVDTQADTIVVYGNNHLHAVPVTVKIQNIIYDIAFTPGTIWISTFAGGLRKSTDMGKSWERVVLPPDYFDSVKPSDTLNFCLQPVSGKFCSENNLNYRVFSVISTNDSTLYVGSAAGINKSTDNGISWRKFNHTNQNNPISGNFIVALGYNPTAKSVWAASWRAEDPNEFYGVSSTTDGGENWNTHLAGEKAHNFGFNGFQTIAATDNGAFRTFDKGQSWILPTSIIDSKTNIPLLTNVIYAAAAEGNTIWLGSEDGLAKLDENFTWNGDWTIYFASKKLTSKNNTYAFPNPFSPKTDRLKIKYSTGGKSASVTIRVFDFGMNLVRTIIQNAQRGNPINQVDGANLETNGVIDFWDGRDENGSIVPNGVYFYRVEVNSEDPVFGKIMVLQ